MSVNDEVDPNLLEFARQVAAMPRRISEGQVAPVHEAERHPVVEVAPSGDPPISQEAIPSVQFPHQGELRGLRNKSEKKLRSPSELSDLILAALREVDDCPRQGLTVTVYGSNPWNAMLMIRPEAGPRVDRTLWLSHVREIAARLRDEFDVSEESPSS